MTTKKIERLGFRKGELRADSKRIAFYIVLFFHEKPDAKILDSIDSDFQADTSGRCFAKPVFGNLLELRTDYLAAYAWTRKARGYVFLRKANAEARLGVRFAKSEGRA